jgi:hypothetical protein
MLNKHLLPKFIKEVMTHIPTLALKSVEWKPLLKDLGPLVFKMGHGPLDDSKRQLITNLNVSGLKLTHTPLNPALLLNLEAKKSQGQIILEIYFSQLKNPQGLNLDLRPKYFELQGEQLLWNPNYSWLQMDDDFRRALIQLYQGFYYEDESLFTMALDLIGLTSNLSAPDKQQLIKLFHNHFGPGDQSSVLFKIEKFQESFYELFKFFMEKEVKLSKDFVFLGFYLVTLYLHLEELGLEFNVREAFLKVFPKKEK